MRETKEHKYLLQDDEFERIVGLSGVEPFYTMLEQLLQFKETQLLTKSRKILKSEIQRLTKESRRIESILKIINDDEKFIDRFSINTKMLKDEMINLKILRAIFKKKRAGSKHLIYRIARHIFVKLENHKEGQTIQLKFIYSIFYKNSYENYRSADIEGIQDSLFGKLRKVQEKAINTYKEYGNLDIL